MARREDEIRAFAREVFARERLGALILVGPFLALVVAGAWGQLSRAVPDIWAVGMIVSGFVIGLIVRLLGRGTRAIFYLVSLFLYFLTIFFATALFDVMSTTHISTRLLIVFVAIGISASCGLLSVGLSREERWALRDNRGLTHPENPDGPFTRTIASLLYLFGASALALFVSIATGFGPPARVADDMPWDEDPSFEFWSAELEVDAPLADDARKNGVGLGLEGSDARCRELVEVRHEDCDTNLCRAQRPYVLAGCLETAKAVRDDTEIRW